MVNSKRIDERLKDYATPKQIEIIDAVNRLGSVRKAAKELGFHFSYGGRAIQSVKKKAALAGYAPQHNMNHPVPAPFVVSGTSTLYDENGMKLQWVKTKADEAQKFDMIREWIESLADGIKGMGPNPPAPKVSNADLLTVYPLGDPHFGMYAWAEETGDDFDAAIAEKLTCAAIDRLIESAPPSDTFILLPLGDLIHADSSTNRTPASGATLDVDTRWSKVMKIALRAFIYAIKRGLEKHKRGIVRIVRGNHDPHASVAIALALDAYFHGNDRLTVDLSPADHWYYRFGKVLIGATHGDTTKERDLLGVMAADRAKEWGNTEYRYWYCGHVHHSAKKEYPGVLVEYFRTLAAKDAWHAGQGYRSGRDAVCIVHHKDYGEIERHRCDIGMLT